MCFSSRQLQMAQRRECRLRGHARKRGRKRERERERERGRESILSTVSHRKGQEIRRWEGRGIRPSTIRHGRRREEEGDSRREVAEAYAVDITSLYKKSRSA